MEEMILFFIAIAFILFATIQDVRKREVANWINYTLIAVGIIGKAVISFNSGNYWGFVYSIVGVIAFYGIASAFYYSRVFAGGDAKLLTALGAILPYHSWSDLIVYGFGFIVLLFLIGAVYTLIYSVFLVMHEPRRFLREFIRQVKDGGKWFVVSWILVLIMLFLLGGQSLLLFAYALIVISPLLFCYLKGVENACLIVEMKGNELSEGEWLYEDVKIKGRIIRSSVHGLSKKEVEFIKKSGKKVVIRKGIPFVPAFLAAWIIAVFFFLLFGEGGEKLVYLVLGLLGV